MRGVRIRGPSGPLGGLVGLAQMAILTIVIFFVVQTFVAQPFRVEQSSMENTLCDGDYVLVDKLTPRFDDYSRGDIVVFPPPGARGPAHPYIKRVIGLAGERVEIRDGSVWIDGRRLDEHSYVFAGEPTDPLDADPSWTVPDGHVFVLGDHRAASSDSRSTAIGLIPVASIVGRAWLRYWPPVELVRVPSYDAPAAATVIAAAPPPDGSSGRSCLPSDGV